MLSSRGNKYATMTGKGFRPRQIDLGPWRYLAVAVFLRLLPVHRRAAVRGAAVVVVPEVLFRALDGGDPAPDAGTVPHRLQPPGLWRSVWNSLLLAIGCATIIMLVTSVICWIVVKTKLPGRWLLDNIASLPMVFPGIVLGLSIMILYLYVPIGVYGTIWILLIAYVTRFMPYGLRYNTTSMLQIHKELEESAAMSGASWAHDLPPHHPAAPQARPGRRLDLHHDRLDPRAVELDPALQPRHRGACRS